MVHTHENPTFRLPSVTVAARDTVATELPNAPLLWRTNMQSTFSRLSTRSSTGLARVPCGP